MYSLKRKRTRHFEIQATFKGKSKTNNPDKTLRCTLAASGFSLSERRKREKTSGIQGTKVQHTTLNSLEDNSGKWLKPVLHFAFIIQRGSSV